MSHFSIDWSELSLQVMITFGHFLWQAFFVAILLVIGEQALKIISGRARALRSFEATPGSWRRSANIRYMISCIAFFSLPICVIATFAWVHQSRGPILLATSNTTESIISPAVFSAEPPTTLDSKEVPASPVVEMPADAPMLSIEPLEGMASASPETFWHDWFQVFAPYLLLAYAIGVGLMLARFGLSIVSGSRLRRTLQPNTDSNLVNLIAEQSSRLALRRLPIVALCERVYVPVVVGIVKPMILLPPALLCGLGPHQLAAILSHEMAHIRRCDPIINLVQRIVEALLFFHPATWWISRRISIERENCCDDLAAAGCGRLTYAGALLRMAELCAGIRGLKIAPQLESLAVDGGSTSQLGYRIKRLLGEDHSPRISLTRGAFATIALAAVFGGLSIVAVAQSGGSSPKEGQSTESTKRAENSVTQLIPSIRTSFGDEPHEPADSRKNPQRARNDHSSWIPARPVEAAVSSGGTARILDDHSVQLEGDVPWQEANLQFEFGKPTNVEEIRLEILPVDSPAGSQFGRGGDKLMLFDVKPSLEDQTGNFTSLEFASCNYLQNSSDETAANCIDDLTDTGWKVPPLPADATAHELVLRFEKPITLRAGQRLTLTVDSGGADELAVLNRIRFAFHHAAVGKTAETATMKMRFVFDGEVPNTKQINRVIGRGFGPIPDERLLVDPVSKGIRNVVVFVDTQRSEVELKNAPHHAKHLLLEMVNARFNPHVLIGQVGDTLDVINRDPLAYRTAFRFIRNQALDLKILPTESESIILSKRESAPVRIASSSHPWMHSCLFVLDHPYAAVSDKDGQVTIAGLPAKGKLTFRVYHEGGPIKEVKILGETETWSGGRFEVDMVLGMNDLGEFLVSPKMFSEPLSVHSTMNGRDVGALNTAGGANEKVEPWEISKLYDAGFLRTYLQDHEVLPKPIIVPAVSGKVFDPDGKPASGVSIVSHTPRHWVDLDATLALKPHNSGGVKKSKQDGTFGLPERTEPYRVLLVHESGVANVSHEELLRANGVVTLQKWASVSGTLKLGGKPQAGETIVLHFDTLPWSYSRGGPRLTTTHRTTTDKNGIFSFDRVPPLGGMAESLRGHGAVYQCESGKHSHIEIGAGVTVTGKLSLPERLQKNKLTVYARNHLLPIPFPKEWTEKVTNEERQAWRVKWSSTAEGIEVEDRNFILMNSGVPGSISDDGTFTIFGVPERPMVLVAAIPGEAILLEKPFDGTGFANDEMDLGTLAVANNHDHGHLHNEANQDVQSAHKPQLPKLIVKTVDSDGKPVPNTGVLFYDRNSQRAGQKQKFEMVNKRTDESGVADFGLIPNSFGCLQLSASNEELAGCYTLISTTITKCTQAKPPRANVQTEIKDGILTVTFTMTPHVDLKFNIVDDATNEIVFWSEMFYQEPATNRWWQFALVDGSQMQHNFIPISPQITRETIRISALGYETKVFRLPNELDRSQPIRRDVRLKPMPDVELRVLLPDGTPAKKARLTFHYPNELDCLQVHEQFTDAQGIMTTKFPPSADIGIFRLEHSDGTAELSMKELLDAVKQNPGEVILRSIQLRK